MKMPWTRRGMAALPRNAEVGGSPPREIGGDSRSPWGALPHMGSYGTVEQNPELAGPQRYAIYDEMRLSDPTIRSLLQHIKLPILRAHWDVDPASDDPVDVAVADAVSWNFGLGERPGRARIRGGWPSLLRQQLLLIDYGSMTSEIIWGALTPFRDADGDVHQLRPIVKLGPRYPATIMQFIEPEPNTSEYLGGVIQHQAADVVIPGSKIVMHVLEPENDPWRGTSQIRPCFGPWKLKKNLLLSSAVAYDRYAGGIPVVRFPTGSDDGARGKARGIAQGLRTNEQAWVTLEGTPEEGWSVEILSGSGSIADPIPLLRHYDLQIMSAGLAKFAELGTTDTGSRAVGETLADPFYQALEAVAGLIAADLTDQLIARFVEMNFGAEFDVPTLSYSKITAHDLDAIGRYIAALSSAGINITDESMVAHLRAIGGMPEPPVQPQGPPEGTGLPLAPPGGGFIDRLTGGAP